MATTASPGPGAGTMISSSVTGAPLLLDTTPRTAVRHGPSPLPDLADLPICRVDQAAFSRMWIPQADPSPMTWVSPTLAPAIWRSPASPRRWVATSHTLAIPVAAMGWPLDSSPPETLTGVVPSRQVAPELKKSTAPPGSHSPRLS